MEQHIPQEEVRRTIISDMVKKKNSIVPVIGEDTIVYKDKDSGNEIPFQEFILNEFQKKYPYIADIHEQRSTYSIFADYPLETLIIYATWLRRCSINKRTLKLFSYEHE